MSQAAGTGDTEPTTLRLCPACDYDLRGITSARCPECGLVIENAPPLTIPWEHRRQMGYVRAFWRTVRLAMFQCRRLAQAVGAPVDEKAAKRFRLIVSLIAAAPPAAILLAVMWHEGGTGFINVATLDINDSGWGSARLAIGWEWSTLWSGGATLVPILPIGMLLTIWFATGSARLWFRERSESGGEKRSATLSMYACAPLIWLPIAAAAVAGLLAFGALQNLPTGPEGPFLWLGTALGVICVVITLVCLVAWWLGTLQLLSRTTNCSWSRLIATGIFLPIGWAFSAVIGLGLWPCFAGLLWIAIDSLRK